MEESTGTGRAGIDPSRSPRTIPLVAEILGYVGGALALGAVVALLTAYWAQLGFYGRVGIALGLALAGLVGGWAFARSDAPAANRLSQFLLFVGVTGAGAAVGFDVYELIVRQFPETAQTVVDVMFRNKAADWAVFWALATMAVVGGAVWWRRRTVLQHTAFGLGVGLGTLMLLPLLPVDGPEWGAGAVLAVLGLVWGGLGLKGWLPPEPVALSLASLGILGGIEMMEFAIEPTRFEVHWMLWLGLAVSIALVVASLLIKRVVLLGFGGVGICLFAFQLIDATFRGTLWAPVAMLVAGLVFVATAVFVAMRLPRASLKTAPAVSPASAEVAIAAGEAEEPEFAAEKPEPEPIPLVAEILGYVGGAFAVGAAIALMTTFWAPLGPWGRLAIAAAGVLLGIVGGFAVGRQGSRGAHRLEQFMLAIGTVAIGFLAGIAAYEILVPAFGPVTFDQPDRASLWAQAIGAWAAALAGLAIWWPRRTGLQLAVFATAIFGGIGMTSEILGTGDVSAWWYSGAAMLVFALAFWAGALLRFLTPENVAYAFGSAGLFLGLQGLVFNPTTEAEMPVVMWTGLLLSVAMIVASIPMRRAVVLGFGAVGVVLWSVTIVNELFGGRIAGPVMMLVVGVVFVGMAVLVAIMLPRLKSSDHADPAKPPPFGPQMGAPA